MEIPGYEPFYLHSLDGLRAEIARLGLRIPVADSTDALFAPRQIAGRTLPNGFCAQPIATHGSLPGANRHQSLADGGFSLLWHAPPSTPLPPCRNRIQIAQLAPPCPGDLDDGAVELQLEALAGAAKSAIAAGFDGVDISCHRGTLAEKLLAARGRPGRFGGPLENRMRFLLEALRRIRAENPGAILAVRLNAFHACEGGFGVDSEDFRKPDPAEPLALARALEAAGVSILNPAANHPNLRGPGREHRPLTDSDSPHEHPLAALDRLARLSGELAKAAPGLSVIAGGFGWLRDFAPHAAAALLGSGPFAMAGFGRGALAFPGGASSRQWPRGRVCIDCGACTALDKSQSPVGCVVRDGGTFGPAYQGMRRTQADVLREGLSRCHFCEAAPCVSADPLRTPVPGIVASWLKGDHGAARKALFSANPLPGAASRLSPAWMEAEGACIETHLSGRPVPILDLQASIAWEALQAGKAGLAVPGKSNGRSAAIIGSGPAGLGAAAFLLEKGYAVQLHEKSHVLGGMPARVVPGRRTGPLDREIGALLGPALRAGRLSVSLGSEILPGPGLENLRRGVDAVLVCTGLWREPTLGGRGGGVLGGLEFLEAFKSGAQPPVPARVAVLAGGDCAMESARLSRESGALHVYVVFGGERSALHWHMPERWFATPGVHAMWEWQPLRYERAPDGGLRGLHIRHTGLGASALLEIGMAVEAMGLGPDPRWAGAQKNGAPGIHFAGAILNGGASVASCLADGRAAAAKIHAALFP